MTDPGTAAWAARLLDKGMRHLRAGRLADAGKACQRVLRRDSRHPGALHLAGLVEAEKGNVERGGQLLKRACEADPGNADILLNLARLQLESESAPDAVGTLKELLAIDDRLFPAWGMLATALTEVGDIGQAREALERAIDINPAVAMPHHQLGVLLKDSEEPEAATEAFRRALQLDASVPGHFESLATLLYVRNRLEEAAEIYRSWHAAFPEDPRPVHLLAACTGDGVPERAGDGFVETVFDNFAETFDEQLAGLDYRAPALLEKALKSLPPAGDRRVLDAGCGTGLCGEFLRPLASELTGVDLSGGMLEKAAATGCYDSLEKAELTQWLAGQSAQWNLIVSADTFCYFGDLAALLKATAGALKPDGLLMFTLETHDASDEFVLNPHGRYSHRADYARSVLQASGFTDMRLDEATLRRERDADVRGVLVRATREA